MIDISKALMERYGKDYLSYSSIKNALADMALFDKYMKGELKYHTDALQFGTMYDDMLFSENFDEKYLVYNEEEILAGLPDKEVRQAPQADQGVSASGVRRV